MRVTHWSVRKSCKMFQIAKVAFSDSFNVGVCIVLVIKAFKCLKRKRLIPRELVFNSFTVSIDIRCLAPT